MKEKHINNGKKLESLESELFGTFDPEDELWIAGGSGTITYSVTFSPSGRDEYVDADFF